MGNLNSITNLEIEHLFRNEMTPRNTNLEVSIDVELPLGGTVRVHLSGEQKAHLSYAKPGTEKKNNSKADYSWKPDTHMRDFTVMNPFEKSEVRIARWAGIGVIVVEAMALYVTMYYEGEEYDPDGDTPQVRIQLNTWNHSDTAKSTLSNDLGLGMDVLFIAGADMQVHHLCEERDARDNQESLVLFPQFDKMSQKLPEEAKQKHRRLKEPERESE